VSGAISGSGTVEANGGTLELVNAISASSGTAFEIFNSAPSSLLLNAAPGSGNTFTFLGANGNVAFASDTSLNDTFSGLNVGTGGAKTNFVDIEGHTVTISSDSGEGTTSGSITLSDGAVLHLSNLSSTSWFSNAISDGAGGTDIFVSDTACYCRGTLILTERGEVAVEDLAIGDRVMTISGEAEPIKWIGRRSYQGRFIAGRRWALPVRIGAGALADGVPARDLFLSPAHALYIEGVLVEAEHLLNGATITQAQSIERVEYFHIELAAHHVIFADGAPAETYVDTDNRGIFGNASEYAALYPAEPVQAWQFCAARLEEDAPELAAIRARIARRAGLPEERAA